MSVVPPPNGKPGLPLTPGQRLKQPEFHRLYETCPDGVKFELIGGVVYMPSPEKRRHGGIEPQVTLALGLYAAATPGVEVLGDATTILGEESEPQPDLQLRILSAYGGLSRETADDYVGGSPELIVEVADSSRRLDLGRKRDDYERNGVVEYLVVDLRDEQLHWFHFPSGRPVRPSRQGVWKSRVFPGLWLDGPALLARESVRLIAAVQQGLASRDHERFVKRLEATRRKQS
jgi:Uma2 family endonuclease